MTKGLGRLSIEDRVHQNLFVSIPPRSSIGELHLVYGSPLGLTIRRTRVSAHPTHPRRTWFMELPLMWDVLAAEFGHESNHHAMMITPTSPNNSRMLLGMVT